MANRDINKRIPRAFIFGAGGHGRVVLDVLRSAGNCDVIEFLDADEKLTGTEINGARVAGPLELLDGMDLSGCGVVVALGNPVLRQKIAESVTKRGARLINAVHSSAVVTDSAEIGLGNMICAQSMINSNAQLKDNIIINNAAVIEHDTRIDDYATISPGCQIGGRVEIGRAAFICTGAIVLPRMKIGAGAIVGAGALVTKDVPENVLVYGSPAKVVEKIGPDFDYRRLG